MKTNKRIGQTLSAKRVMSVILILLILTVMLCSCSDEAIDHATTNKALLKLLAEQSDSDGEIEFETITITESPEDGYLLLVNNSNAVPEKYESAEFDCIYKKNAPYYVRSTEMYLQSQAIKSMKKMFAAAKEDGIENILVIDSYRTNEKQKKIFNGRVAKLVENGMSEEDAKAEIGKTVALPGHSEHQVGLAIDIDLYDTKYDSFDDTELAKWMSKNSWKYGWIMRYPGKKSKLTGISNESWHYRYVGICHAQYMYENDLCLEEYIQQLHDDGAILIDSIDGKYEVIYCKARLIGDTKTDIPQGCDYTVSGDNQGGYIITVKSEQ